MLPDAAGIPVTPDLPTLADATTELAVTLDRAARTGADDADPIATAALLEAAQLVARAADLLERTRDRLDPAGATARRAAVAAFLEREAPELFAPAIEPASADATIRRRGPSPAQPTAASLTAILAHEGIHGSVTAPSRATLRAVVPAGSEARARELLEPYVPYGVELEIAPADPG